MASLEMEGPYAFTSDVLNDVITRALPGNYALGDKIGETFKVRYIGRGDSDVKARLSQHLGEPYKYFKYSYATSPKAAFEKECKNYHDFGGPDRLDNNIHPDRPSNSKDWKCPVCNKFD